jgi:FkbM family methyltransferase
LSTYHHLKSSIRDFVRSLAASFEIITKHRSTTSLRRVGRRLVAQVQTPGGALFVHLLDLGVGRPLYTGKEYEPEETALLLRTLKPGMTVVDVGANVGYMALLSARCVGPTGRVLAIEPDAANAQLLAENIARNGYQNITVCQCAVGSEPGTATLYRSAWNMGNHRLNAGAAGQAIADQAVQVEVETVDRLVRNNGISRVDFVKMDVEGYEPGVLAGMRETLARDRPAMLTEFWPHGMRDAGFEPDAFLESCLRAGYEACTLTRPDRPLRTVDSIFATLPDQQSGTYENLLFIPVPVDRAPCV